MNAHRLAFAPIAGVSCILLAACSSAPARPPATQAALPDDARGGRLIDAWRVEAQTTFEPDSPETEGVADGREGPRNDGTLLLGDGRVLLNDDGHDYRLKNLFGWDLRGADGIYGPGRMAKPYVIAASPLTWDGSVAEIASRLERGDASLPAFGSVLEASDLEAIAAFIVRVRDGSLPSAASIFELTSSDTGHYALLPGGDAVRGKALFADRCAGCHAADGTRHLFDDGAYSLGSHARQKAYEDWMKILNGQPGTPMGRQVRGATASEMTQEILDLFAALCDREAFPRGPATAEDVADGDLRCGAYLR
jgi:mono/diheme cytochrome c family protein